MCTVLCKCTCAFWHFKKVCGWYYVNLVCVAALPFSFSGETVCSLPQCIKAHSFALGEGRNSPFPPHHLCMPPSFPTPSSTLSFPFLTRSLYPPPCCLLCQYLQSTLHWQEGGRLQPAEKSRGALAKCGCPLRTWIICCTTNTLFLCKHMYRHRGASGNRTQSTLHKSKKSTGQFVITAIRTHYVL